MTSSLKYKAQYIRKTALINNKIKLFRQLYKILVSLYVSSPSQYRKYNAYNKDLEINLVFSHKYQYIGTKANSNMKERLLIKCDTTIYADEITNLLIENNIVSRQHDEGQDQNPGAYGAITGIAIYVFEKDYEKAVEIINPIIDSRNESHVWCPKCGSYNVSAIAVSNKYGTAIALWCIFLFLIPGLYLVWANDLGIRSTIGDYIALSMFISFLVVAFLGKISNANYICKDCNKRFHHK